MFVKYTEVILFLNIRDWLIFDGFYWTSVTVPAHTQEEAGPNYRHKNAIWKQMIQSKKVKWSFHVFLGRYILENQSTF